MQEAKVVLVDKQKLTPLVKDTLFILFFTFLKIPLLWWVSPRIIENSDERIVFKIPLRRRTKNHLGSMYFAALAMGAEAAVAVTAIQEIRKKKARIDFVFKSFTADFLKRADGDVYFVCDQVKAIAEMVDKVNNSTERFTQAFSSYAVVPSTDESAKVAEFTLTLSLRKRA